MDSCEMRNKKEYSPAVFRVYITYNYFILIPCMLICTVPCLFYAHFMRTSSIYTLHLDMYYYNGVRCTPLHGIKLILGFQHESGYSHVTDGPTVCCSVSTKNERPPLVHIVHAEVARGKR